MNVWFNALHTRVRFGQTLPSQQQLETLEKEIVDHLQAQGIKAEGYFLGRRRNVPLVFHVDYGKASQAKNILLALPDVTPATDKTHHLNYKNIPVYIDHGYV